MTTKASKSTRSKKAPAKKRTTKRKAAAKKKAAKAKVKPAPEPADKDEPHPLAEITLEERDWLMSKFMVERVSGTQAKLTAAKQQLEILMRDHIAQKAAQKAQINTAEAEVRQADNEMKVFLGELEHKLGINLQNYTWQSDGKIIYMGDLEEIGNQQPSQQASQPKKTESPEPGSEDEAEAEFLNSRVV